MKPSEQQGEFSPIMEEEIKRNLFTNAMQGNWEEVISIYRQHPVAHMAKITRSGETALHIAISDGQEVVVEKLVSLAATDSLRALSVKNELGNTPLHLAASLGNIGICSCIATRDQTLIGERNKDGETPFFLAVLHGNKDTFLRLQSFCKKGDGENYCRRNDGETILHSAIAGEYFELASIIIRLHTKLVDSVNVHGFSPLHLLASKPSAFRSGSHVSGFQRIIYNCIFVDKLEPKAHERPVSQRFKYDGGKANYPENYHSFVSLVILLKKAIKILVGYDKDQEAQQQDAENPRSHEPHVQEENKSSIFQAERGQVFPLNYSTCFHGLEFLCKSMLVILGVGSMQLVKLREEKEKHAWSVRIMVELLKNASLYEYEDTGTDPRYVPSRKEEETVPYTLTDGCNVDFNPNSFVDKTPGGDDSSKDASQGNKSETPGGDDSSKDASQGNKSEKRSKGNGNGLPEVEKWETPMLIATKNGVMEMVETLIRKFPVAIHDTNSDGKNAVLLAVENRQPHVYKYLLKLKKTIFRKLDKDGNSALHLAARMGDHRAWLIPGAALQMQWEIKWYERQVYKWQFVKDSMPPHFFVQHNNDGKTPMKLFTQTHQKLVEEGGKWLTNTSQSCSVVAALIATVAFATSATVPGGVNQESGSPTLENESAFSIFAIASLLALCFSVTSVVMFLSILTSRYQEKDFGRDLPAKLLVGLTSLFVSIASMLVSFCAGHFFVLKDKLKYAAFPVYAVTCLPVSFFAVVQFPLYFDLLWATFKKVPQRSYM